MDELANNVLLARPSEEPSRQSPLRNVTAVERSPPNPSDPIARYREKPLPDLPRNVSALESNHLQKKPTVTSQAKNPRVIRKGETQPGRPKISHPIPLVVEHSSDAARFANANFGHPRSPNTLKRSMTEAEILNNKTNIFMDQAPAEEAEPIVTRKRSIGSQRVARFSPLQRGRHAFTKASRAIADRISRSTSTSRIGEKKLAMSATGDSPPGSSHGSIPSLRPNTDDDSGWGRHHRRIAEGENLARPKIQAMTSDGQIRRKPLPLQESNMMGSPSLSPYKSHAPTSSSGKDRMGGSPQRPTDVEYDINFPEDRYSSDDEASSQFDHLQIKSAPRMKALPRATRPSLEYLVVNGLAQHPDTMVFASPPVKSSEPKTRPGPQADVENHRRVPSSKQEDRGEEDGLVEVCPNSRSRTTSNGNMSVKRKSATRDLRSQLSVAMKRTKRGSVDSDSSKEELVIGGGTGQREKADRPTLKGKERNRLSALFNTKTAPPTMEAGNRGYFIHDYSKENEPMTFAEHKGWWSQGRGSGGKKSSNHRRSSLFSRDSRIHAQHMDASEGDNMAIDELQTNDKAYQVGEKKR